MFYVLIFGILAVVLVVVGIGAMTRRRRYTSTERNEMSSTHSGAKRRTEKAKRAQSRHDRRKRH